MTKNSFQAGFVAPLPLPLRTEKEVMSTWLTDINPVVSICCPTYNHIDYLEDALRGFMGQVTTFPFEVIIRDDASTDGTTNIVKDFATRYPNIIRSILEKDNQLAKGVRPIIGMLPYVKGEFIALCDGDDYWISSTKLEKQVELLGTNKQCTMCVSQTVACGYQEGALRCSNLICGNDKLLQFFDEITRTYFHTSTYLIRTEILRAVIKKYAVNIPLGDTALRYMLVHYGPFAFLREVVSVYRDAGSGIWSSLNKYNQISWEIRTAEGLYKYFEPEYKRYHGQRLYWLYLELVGQDVQQFSLGRFCANLPRFLYFAIRYRLPSAAIQFLLLWLRRFKKILNFIK